MAKDSTKIIDPVHFMKRQLNFNLPPFVKFNSELTMETGAQYEITQITEFSNSRSKKYNSNAELEPLLKVLALIFTKSSYFKPEGDAKDKSYEIGMISVKTEGISHSKDKQIVSIPVICTLIKSENES